MHKIKLTNDQMNVMLVAVEHGYRQCEEGNNLQAALASVYAMYEVSISPDAADQGMNLLKQNGK